MKEIIFVRHAKSDWGNEVLKDIDRPLSERGYSDAYYTGEWYAQNHPRPDLILSSTATRALNTALIFLRILKLGSDKLQLEESIYESTAENILKVISEQSASVKTLMMVGHNPGFTNVCNELTDEVFFDNIPTCGIVSFHLDIRKWNVPLAKKGKLNYHQFPKEFKNRD